MGQSVSVDTELVDLKEFFRLGQAIPQKPAGMHVNFSSRHHVKVWRFEKQGRIVVDSPVPLHNDHGLFDVDLQQNCSYLILLVQAAGAGSEEPPANVLAPSLEELAAFAGTAFTPRGLTTQAISQDMPCDGSYPQSTSSGAVSSESKGVALRYALFVWQGVSVDPQVKARVLTKAFEFDRVLRIGLLWHHSFLETLNRALVLKSFARPSHDHGDNHGSLAAETVRQSGNQFLIAILDGISKPMRLVGGSHNKSRTTSRSANPRRFVRVGLSVWRSLEATAPGSKSWMHEQKWESVSPNHTIHEPFSNMHSGITGAHSDGEGRIVPRLVLGNGAMNLDERSKVSGSQCDAAVRKRSRGPEDSYMAQSGPANSTSVPSTAVPKTARSEHERVSPSSTISGHTEGDAAPRVAMPQLNLGGATKNEAVGQRQAPADRTDVLGMLNLEEINMSEEELLNSYDPENEENNYHLPNHLYKQLQLKQYRQACSEIMPNAVYLSSYQVASDLECLRRHRITHIVNMAADVCESRFPEHFNYVTYYLKDTNSEDISLLFYRTIEWMQNAITKGGRVLVHCREGVSRSSTMIIAFFMWRFSMSFEAAHEKVRKVRPICNPNTGFTCQLLVFGKKLSMVSCTNNANNPPVPGDRHLLFRIGPHHPKEPFLLLFPVEWSINWPIFDPRFGWVVQHGNQLVLWLGSQIPDAEPVQAAVLQHVQWIESFERWRCNVTIAREGMEPPLLWQLLGLPAYPTDSHGLAVPKPAYDADFEVLSACAARRSAGRSGVPTEGRTSARSDNIRPVQQAGGHLLSDL